LKPHDEQSHQMDGFVMDHLGHGCDNGRIDEFADPVLGRRVVDVRRRDACGVAILGEQFSLESFVVCTRIVEVIRTSHDESRRACYRALQASWRGQTGRGGSPVQSRIEIANDDIVDEQNALYGIESRVEESDSELRLWLRAQERARSGGWGGGVGLVRHTAKKE